MKLYNFKLIQTLHTKTLIITIDLNEFNNVDIHIDDVEEIDEAMEIIKGDKCQTNYYNDCKLSEFLEEIYHDEIDPYTRGEK